MLLSQLRRLAHLTRRSLLAVILSLLRLLRLASRPRLSVHDTKSVDLLGGKDGTSRRTLKDVLEGCKRLKKDFVPTPWLASGHLATIYCTLPAANTETLSYSRRRLKLPDGGTIALDFTPPLSENDPADKRPILVVLHGLTGGSSESYVVNLLSTVTAPVAQGGLGWRAVVVCFRGCAGAELTSKSLYHGAWSYDIRCALKFIGSIAPPEVPMYGVGFSLGANILARYLGLAGADTPLEGAVVIGSPWDFWKGHLKLESSVMGRLYSRTMAGNLRRLISRHKDVLQDDPRIEFAKVVADDKMSLYQFDDAITAKMGGFPNAKDYYHYATSSQFLDNVAIPLLCINAIDDPISSSSAIPFSAPSSNPHIAVLTTHHGGHLGYWTGLFRPKRWIGKVVSEFFGELEGAGRVERLKGQELKGEYVETGQKAAVGWELLEGETVGQAAGDEGTGLVKGL